MLDAVGIVAEDLQRSAEFYGLLGVEFAQIAPAHWEGETESGIRLMLDSADLMKSLNPNWQKPQGGGVVLCFKQGDVAAVDALYRKIIDAGFGSVTVPFNAFWGQRYASVQDPDGNQIDIFSQA